MDDFLKKALLAAHDDATQAYATINRITKGVRRSPVDTQRLVQAEEDFELAMRAISKMLRASRSQ